MDRKKIESLRRWQILKVEKETIEFFKYFAKEYIDHRANDEKKALRAIEAFLYRIDREVKEKGKAVIEVIGK